MFSLNRCVDHLHIGEFIKVRCLPVGIGRYEVTLTVASEAVTISLVAGATAIERDFLPVGSFLAAVFFAGLLKSS